MVQNIVHVVFESTVHLFGPTCGKDFNFLGWPSMKVEDVHCGNSVNKFTAADIKMEKYVSSLHCTALLNDQYCYTD